MHHFEKWYNLKLKEEMEWEDHVAQEVAEAEAGHVSTAKTPSQPDPSAAD